MNHSKENQDGSQPPPKRQRKFTRSDLDGPDKYKVVTWMRVHPDKTAREVKEQFPNILKSISERAIQKWRKIGDEKLEKLKQSGKKRIKEKSKGLFPTIEKEMLRQRDERVEKNRDRSKKWMVNATKKLINNKEKLNALNLTQFEKDNIDNFKGSDGWVEKVAERNDLKKKTKQSTRKMTVPQFIDIRKVWLPKQRVMARIGHFGNRRY